MSTQEFATTTDLDLAAAYHRDGFYFPFDVVDAAEAAALLAELETAEREVAHDRSRLSLLRTYTSRLLPSFDRLIRNPRILAAVSSILGPDLLVWGNGLFIKEPQSKSFVSWHQDLGYWGMDADNEVTVWVALTPSSMANGCVRFVPGSHKKQLVPHVDSYADNNLLSRGQEIAVEVDEAQAVDVVLQPGQASFHHGHMFHGSSPNTTDGRRIGVAIRYIVPSMRHASGEKVLVSLVSGTDRFGHFDTAGPFLGRMLDSEFEAVRLDAMRKRDVLYAGADSTKVRTNRKA